MSLLLWEQGREEIKQKLTKDTKHGKKCALISCISCMFRRDSLLMWVVERNARVVDFESTTFLFAAGTLCVDRTPRTALVIVNSDASDLRCGPQHLTLDPQLRSMLQWAAASMADIPYIQLSPDRDLKQVIATLNTIHHFQNGSHCVYSS